MESALLNVAACSASPSFSAGSGVTFWARMPHTSSRMRIRETFDQLDELVATLPG